MIINVWAAYDWFQRVKDKEFESNSQRVQQADAAAQHWFQRVKDKEFESNSQHESAT